jgi:N-acylneuraminate cytidylyltransferase
MKIAAFIPARGGSKSIPSKNSKLLAGRPLILWAVEAACACPEINEVYVSTDSNLIGRIVESYRSDKLTVVGRSPETATDEASTESAMLEFAADREFDTIVLLQATSPLTTSNDISGALRTYRDRQADSLLSVVRQRRFIWENNEDGWARSIGYQAAKRPRRQEWDGFMVENGAIYITSRQRLLKTGVRLSGSIATFEMPAETYHELDDPMDWTIVEAILNAPTVTPIVLDRLKDIKLLVMDVDGVLTDAGMYYSEQGEELKKFNTRDGKGVEILRHAGIKTAIITGEDTEIVSRRGKKLKIDAVCQGITDKGKELQDLARAMGVELREVAYIGDDINDIEAMSIAGFSACPVDAVPQVTGMVDYICRTEGGKGCVREMADLIIKAQGAS